MSGRDALVGGSVGPLAPPNRGTAGLSEGAARAMFREQIEGLLEGGIDVIVLETFSDLEQLLLALDEARRATDIPVIASLTFGEDLTLADGTQPNGRPACSPRPAPTSSGSTAAQGRALRLNALRRWAAPDADDPPRSIMPNAGLPQRLEGRFIYAAGAGYFAQVTPRMVEAGARIVGGCCGTTPEHIASMRAALETVTTTGAAAPRTEVAPSRTNSALADRATLEAEGAPPPTRLAELLAAKRFVVSVEIDPPRSIRIERTIEAARLLQDAGVDVGQRLGLGDGQGADGRLRRSRSGSSTTSTSSASSTARRATGT